MAIYAYVGSFSYTGSEGIHICRLDPADGSLTYLKTVYPEINTNCVNIVGNVLYCTDEKAGDPAKNPDAGGGRVYAFSINPETGDLTLLNKKETFCVNPSYVTVDPTGKYALVPHFAVGPQITKTFRTGDGSVQAQTERNDNVTCLFRLEEDGGFDSLCDVFYHETDHSPSMVHKTYQKPGENLYAENDLGADRLYFLQINYEEEKLEEIAEADTGDVGRGPRHGAFHPALPYLYINYEHKGAVSRYDISNLTQVRLVEEQWFVDDENLVTEGDPGDNQAELMFHPNGKILYTFMRGKGLAVAYQVDETTGAMTLLQNLKLPTNDPRGAVFTPDGRYILIAGHTAGETETLRVREDGTLENTGLSCRMANPSCIAFYGKE